jgi:pimeloyl-ACP methyl ester carboxylesterase/heme-degrading monooxygenase HmoA
MRSFLCSFLLFAFIGFAGHGQTMQGVAPYEVIKIASHVPGLKEALLHEAPAALSGKTPVLFIHGSSFPSALAAGFRMGGGSFMDELSSHDFDSYALDFLGYGYSDRYADKPLDSPGFEAPGRAVQAYRDVDSAVNFILRITGSKKINLIAHSWGGSVALLYASKFSDKIENLVLLAPLTPGKSQEPAEVLHSSYIGMTPHDRVEAMRQGTPAGEVCPLEPELASSWQKLWLASDPRAATDPKGNVFFPTGPMQDIDALEHGQCYYDASVITCRTLVIRGEWDKRPSDTDARQLMNWLTNVKDKQYIVVPKSTHVLHLEKNRHQLYNETLQFLNQSPMSTSTKPHAIAVIFEVIPNDGKKQEYLDIAAELKPDLVKIDGFISIERFQSLSDPGKILSLSFWRDEEAIQQWRTLEVHRTAQAKGREYIFKDYHLRIADVVRDYSLFDRNEAPVDSKEYHHTK